MLKFQPLCLQKVTQDIAKNSFGLVLAQVLQVVLELVEKRARFQQEINRDTSDTFHWVFLSFFFFFWTSSICAYISERNILSLLS